MHPAIGEHADRPITHHWPSLKRLVTPFRAVIIAKLEQGLSAQCIYHDLRDEAIGVTGTSTNVR